MEHTPLNSSMIESAGFEDGIMEVKFKSNGKIYRYYTTGDVYDQLCRSSSPGSLFNKIKGGLQKVDDVVQATEHQRTPPPVENDDEKNWFDFEDL